MAIEVFNIKYKRAHASAVEFKTEVDSEYTAHEQRSCLQTLPRNSWTLDFEKTPSNFKDVRSFFIRHKGKFKAFRWQWKETNELGRYVGGDGKFYMVRFDTDKLDFKIDELGYKMFSVPIVQVLSYE